MEVERVAVFECATVKVTFSNKLAEHIVYCSFKNEGIVLSISIALGPLLIETLIPRMGAEGGSSKTQCSVRVTSMKEFQVQVW